VLAIVAIIAYFKLFSATKQQPREAFLSDPETQRNTFENARSPFRDRQKEKAILRRIGDSKGEILDLLLQMLKKTDGEVVSRELKELNKNLDEPAYKQDRDMEKMETERRNKPTISSSSEEIEVGIDLATAIKEGKVARSTSPVRKVKRSPPPQVSRRGQVREKYQSSKGQDRRSLDSLQNRADKPDRETESYDLSLSLSSDEYDMPQVKPPEWQQQQPKHKRDYIPRQPKSEPNARRLDSEQQRRRAMMEMMRGHRRSFNFQETHNWKRSARGRQYNPSRQRSNKRSSDKRMYYNRSYSASSIQQIRWEDEVSDPPKVSQKPRLDKDGKPRGILKKQPKSPNLESTHGIKRKPAQNT